MSMRTTAETSVVMKGLHFAEAPTLGPDNRLYLSDFYAQEVLRVDVARWTSEVVVDVPHQPSGLGWLEDGSLLIVSMNDRRLLRLHPDGTLTEHADLGTVARGSANDMHVDAAGRAWVGDFGFDFYGLLRADPEADPLFGPDADPPTASIAVVDTDGSVRAAARGMRFPNGMVQLTDGRLVVAETVGKCLTAFEVDGDALTDRTTYADLRGVGPEGADVLPDGICIDAEDGIWVSDPTGQGVVRVVDGIVTERVGTTQPCFAVALIGDQLLACTAETSNPNVAGSRRTGRLETTTVGVPAR